MRIISVFDTSISEYNLGNKIIMDSVERELNDIFKNKFQYNIPYQQINKSVGKCIKQSEFVFFGGTNSLTSFMNKYRQWDVNIIKTLYVKNVIMMGIGWWQYQKNPNLYTKFILKRCLSNDYYHSARDSYTEAKLKKMGFKVINTGCPTLWNLTKDKLKKIDLKSKSKNVIITLTDYNKDKILDREIFDLCINNYEKVYFWPQGVGDYDYLNQINKNKNIIIINSDLKSYDEVLENCDVDYIGTRLHAGIRALQKNVRAFFIAIDNRTIEMGNDIGLTYVNRCEIASLQEIINQKYNAKLKINYEAINRWKLQFKCN
ncbi:polysaccharide pyruvyl transferase family protein [Clostridium botulinum]|uniref:polysaccharide pyruvyl transferase family protein n=1 Tax=Clostridium botulinum TaxID=1491 RepID=UPI001967576A|nr:polysaccharide pyruvyl transferase family protein [Clostridium botulinum]MBN1072558.1 polysaccharide pyruvyl transferase family protein [Clostridium botulinum]